MSAHPTRPADRAPSKRTTVRRNATRAAYDRATVDAILDAGLVAHLGFVQDGQPYVVPTLHARSGDVLYVHGSAASRTLRELGGGVPACVTVTLLDGLVLARSVFEHSINYRSVMVFGDLTRIEEPDEKLAALRALSDGLLPGRWHDVREPSDQELKATAVLGMALDECSAKVRSGAPDDGDSPDAELDAWAGVIPLEVVAAEPRPDPLLRPGIAPPGYVTRYQRPGLVPPPAYHD